MSKGLESLERLKNTLLAEGYWQDVLQDVAIVEKELKEYEEMKAIKGTTTFDKAIEDTLINACPNVAKKLKRLEELEKAFDALSKDDEKAKKELSKEIEKNRALEIIKKKLPPLMRSALLDYCNKEEYDLLKEVLL